jgi:hypothetical protein
MEPNGQVGKSDDSYGVPVDAEDPWVAAKKEMYPAASLMRVGAQARFAVGTVSVVGIALTALGLVTASSITAGGLSRVLAFGASCIAIVAVICALIYLGPRLDKVNYENLDDVKAWYRVQFGRARLVVLAGWLLVLSVGLGAGAGLAAAWSSTRADDPVLSLVIQTANDQSKLTATVSLERLHPGDAVDMTVTGPSDDVVVSGKTTADAQGVAKLQGDAVIKASRRAGPGTYQLVVWVAGHQRGSLKNS